MATSQGNGMGPGSWARGKFCIPLLTWIIVWEGRGGVRAIHVIDIGGHSNASLGVSIES